MPSALDSLSFLTGLCERTFDAVIICGIGKCPYQCGGSSRIMILIYNQKQKDYG
jgi:hypothetical protein